MILRICLQVNASFSLIKIKEFDLSSGNMVSTGYLQITWYDELLVWNPTSFGGIKKLNMPNDYNWRPGLAFSRSDEEESLLTSTVFAQTSVSNDGEVVLITGGHFHTICDLDTTQYPFDKHSCNYELISTSYDSEEVILHSPQHKINLDNYIENGEWHLTDTVCTPGGITGTTESDSVKIATLNNIIQIRRRPEFVLLHAAGPLFLIDALCIVVCLVPVDSGERISYSVTVFLAFVFLSGSIVAEMPRNSLKLTTLSWELVTVNILTTFNVLWSVYIVRLSRRHGNVTDLPRVFIFVTHVAKRITNGLSRRIKTNGYRNRRDSNDSSVTGNQPEVIGKNERKEECIYEEEEDIKWHETIKLLDMVYFVINLTCYIIMAFTMTIVFAAHLD